MGTASIYITMLAEIMPKAKTWLLEYMHLYFSQYVNFAMVHGNLKKALQYYCSYLYVALKRNHTF